MRMSRRGWWSIALVGLAVFASLGLYELSSIPASWHPVSSHGSNHLIIDGKSYEFENEILFGQNNGWLNYSYGGVVFRFHLWCSIEADTGYLCGSVSQPNGLRYGFNFSDGLPFQNPPWQTALSPDFASAVQYQQGGQARLLLAS